MRHQLAHRGLEVVVADDAAGDAGRAGSDIALVDDEDVLAAAETTGPEFPGQMPGRRESVDPGPDDDVAAAGRDWGRDRDGGRGRDRDRGGGDSHQVRPSPAGRPAVDLILLPLRQ